ncbi:MAG: SIMPL domain-containing protein [Bacteriovoracaceae bacterium]|nr:SIMPL domain-containing protein [Bacteroidota bacterium]
MKTMMLMVLCTGLAFAQPADRTIEVKGTGTYKTMPDLGVLTIEAIVINKKFADVVKGLNAKTESLTAQLQMVGFKKEEIKTADFNVAKNMVWENGSNIDKGYIAHQNISVEFSNSKERIGSIITSFMNSENEVRFSLHFTLSEHHETLVRDELLKRTVNDAQSRAEVIASAAKQKLGIIKHISYGSVMQHPVYQTALYKAAAAENDQSLGFDVKELSFSDEVTMVWELK